MNGLLFCLGLALCSAPQPGVLAASSVMPAGSADAANPPGFSSFCLRFAAQCQSAPGESAGLVPDASAVAMLRAVNREVNRAIRPLDDDRHYGRPEFWTIPADGYGDCEDYALAKRARLIEAGIPAGLLRLAVVMTPRSVRHVVLTVSTSQGDYVLDSLFDEILPWDMTGYRWLARQKTEDARGWTVLDPATSPVRLAERK